MEPNKHSIGSIIAGILFLIIFIGGMIGMYVGSKTDLRICLMSLGAILLSVGIVAAVNGIKIKGAKKITPLTIAAIFILIGAGLIIYPLLNIFTGFVIGNEIIVYSALGMFVLIGLLLIIIPIAKNLYLKKVCTVVVEAKCTELASSGFYYYDGIITGSESKITRFKNVQFSRFILNSPLSKLVMRVIVRRNGGECKLPVHVQWFDKMKLDAIILMHYPLMSLQS